jgi:hypothetical protein
MTSRIVWTAAAGAVAGVLTLLVGGVEGFPRIVVLNDQCAGVPFAVLITATIAAQDSSLRWNLAVLRYCSAALVLAIGPPCGLLVAGAVDRLLGTVAPGRGTFLSVFVPLAVAGILLWALCLAAFLSIVGRRWKSVWFLQAAVLGLAIFALVAVTDFVARGVFVPLFIVSEQIGSAIFLVAAAQDSNQAGARGRVPGTARQHGQ